MELPIFLILLVFGLSTVTSHPKNSDVISKDYYKRQILQPIPGYIPVYIKTEEAPLVRREKVKHNVDVPIQKATEENNQPITRDTDVASKTEDEKPLKHENPLSEKPEKLENPIKAK